MFRIFFLFLFLVSCAPLKPIYIDPEVQPYVTRFTEIVGIYPYGISIKIVDSLPGTKVGECYSSQIESTISILRSYWNQSSDYGKEHIIFHELGHCFLGLEHQNIYFQDRCPGSIMFPLAFGNEGCYIIHRNELLDSFW
jgi:hypothetical protein